MRYLFYITRSNDNKYAGISKCVEKYRLAFYVSKNERETVKLYVLTNYKKFIDSENGQIAAFINKCNKINKRSRGSFTGNT